jgi:protein TonB
VYADRYARSGGFKPGSLGIALAINAAAVAALMLASPTVRGVVADPPLLTKNIPIDPPPEPLPPPPEVHKQVTPSPSIINTVPQVIKLQPADPIFELPIQPYVPPLGPASGEGTGTTVAPIATPTPSLPALISPKVDPRYADLFQPPYPPSEQRAGRTGRVEVRVLVGVDGRVRQVDRLLATSDAFFEVTRQRALTRWRFTPATRGGIPVEAWRTMGVSFVLNDE